MKKINYFLLTKSIGFGLNSLSFLQPKKATQIAYRLFSEPRKGKLFKDNLPDVLKNIPSQQFPVAKHICKLTFGKEIKMLFYSFTAGKVMQHVGKNYCLFCKKREVPL